MKKYSHGLVVGKFMPLHTGHIFLLETALDQCEDLTVLVFTRSDDPIAGVLRINWVREQFPMVDVIHHSKSLPRDESGSDNWGVWKKSIEEHCAGSEFDAVFSSESYGQRLANDLNADHVEVDRLRKTYPISGSEIRNDPMTHREFIPAIVRPYYGDLLK